MSIKTIVFDIGRVLFDYCPNLILDNLLPSTPYKESYLNGLFNSAIWQQLDRGDITKEEAYSILLKKNIITSTQESDINILIDEFPDHLPIIEETKDLFIQLEKKYPIYLLSNFQDKPFDRLYKNNPFLHLSSGMIISAKVNCMKPEPEIYKLLLSTYNLTANETLFIDDLEPNISAAKKLGINGIQFTTIDQLKADLNHYLQP